MILFNSYLLVCIDIKVKTKDKNWDYLHWELGPCKSSNLDWQSRYEKRTEYTQRCCLSEGKHQLTCYNTRYAEGWYENTLEIQGHNYCNDFIGYKLIRDVLIKGK